MVGFNYFLFLLFLVVLYELMKMRKFFIFQIGYYRLIAFEFEVKAVGWMIDIVEEESWKIDEINKQALYSFLKDVVPHSVFEVIFQKYMIPSIEFDVDSYFYK